MASYVLASGEDGFIVLSKRGRGADEEVASTDAQDRKRTKPDVGTAGRAARDDDPTVERQSASFASCSAAPSPDTVDAPSALDGKSDKENIPLTTVEARSPQPATGSAPVNFSTTVVNHLSRPVHIPKPRETVSYRIKTPDDATLNAVVAARHDPGGEMVVESDGTKNTIEESPANGGASESPQPVEKEKRLTQTRLDRFRIVAHNKEVARGPTPKVAVTDPEVVRLVGTITFPFCQPSSESNTSNRSWLRFPRVAKDEIDVTSTTNGQACIVRVAEQGSLLEMRRYREAAYEKFATEKKAFETKKRMEQRAILHKRIAKVQMEANQVLQRENTVDVASTSTAVSSKYCYRVSSP